MACAKTRRKTRLINPAMAKYPHEGQPMSGHDGEGILKRRRLMPLNKAILAGTAISLFLSISLLTGCEEEPSPPYLPSSAELEGVSGDRILFCEYLSGHLLANRDDARVTERCILYTVNANGSTPTKLLDIHTSDGRLMCFDLSPDRNRVAFFSPDGYLSVLRIDSRKVTNVVEASGAYLAWSPDGSKIAYTSGGDLYVINADGSDSKKLAEHKGASYHTEGTVTGYVHYPVWSADGEHILFDNFTAPQFLFGGSAMDVRNRCIYSVNIATTEIQMLLCSAEIRGRGPDEAKIVIWAHRKVDEQYTDQRVVMDDQGNVYTEYKCIAGKWSPDGGAIAFTSFDSLLVVNPITCAHIEIDEIEDVTDFIWSPDGQHIAFVSVNGIHIVRRDLSQGFLVYQMPEVEENEEGQHMALMLIDWLT